MEYTQRVHRLKRPQNRLSFGSGGRYGFKGYVGATLYPSGSASYSRRRRHFLSGISPSLVLSVDVVMTDSLWATAVRDDPLGVRLGSGRLGFPFLPAAGLEPAARPDDSRDM